MLETAIEAAYAAGNFVMEAYGAIEANHVDLKGQGDYVTHADKESEDIIIQTIQKQYPDHSFYGEEAGYQNSGSDYVWVIDPIDGTTNFIQGIPQFSISIALMYQNEIQVGVVYDPLKKEMFRAEKGKGAFLNDKPIRVPQLDDLSKAILTTGFPYRIYPYIDDFMNIFKELFFVTGGIRRMGSAALDLAYTACGRFHGYFELKLAPYDIAAGILILEEAGGKVSGFQGENDYFKTGNVIGGSQKVHELILNVTKKYSIS